jgi:hypothetical protein
VATLTIDIAAPHANGSFNFEATEASIRNTMEVVEKAAASTDTDPVQFAHHGLGLLAALKSDEEVNGSHMGCALYLVLIQETRDGTPVHTVAAYQDIEARVTLHDGEVRIQLRTEEGEGPALN